VSLRTSGVFDRSAESRSDHFRRGQTSGANDDGTISFVPQGPRRVPSEDGNRQREHNGIKQFWQFPVPVDSKFGRLFISDRAATGRVTTGLPTTGSASASDPESNRGISPVVGVPALVALTVCLAAVVGSASARGRSSRPDRPRASNWRPTETTRRSRSSTYRRCDRRRGAIGDDRSRRRGTGRTTADSVRGREGVRRRARRPVQREK